MELSAYHKLNSEHLICAGQQRQKICLASKLLTHTTETSLLHYKLLENTANFIGFINNFFDLMNIHNKNDNHTPFTTLYGLAF